MYRDLIQTEYFRVVVVDDVEAVEVCGALKVRPNRWVSNLKVGILRRSRLMSSI